MKSIDKGLPVIKDALDGLYSSMTPKCVIIAELGCATGPNTLKLIPEFVEYTYEKFRANKKEIPEIQVFLNDLYFNDFSTVSRSLPTFLKDLDEERHGDIGPLFISMTPGCYQQRIFPDNFLHFVHCANSAHWLTQVPNDALWNEGESLTKGCLYITENSPPEVIRAYQQQFGKDFYSFLKSRAKEIVKGGRMVVNIMVSSDTHKPHHMWVLKLMNMGLVDEKKVSEMNFHFYPPTMEEVKNLVSSEESFILHKHETFILDWDMPKEEGEKTDELSRAKFVADTARVSTNYIMSTQFGDDFSEEFYRRFTNLVYDHLANGIQLQTFHQVISLMR
ncbi:3 7-dimethylxanthine N-methyltransferase, partial [Bienertia sinuspersici]